MGKMDRIDRIRELVEQLNEASDAYYNSGYTLMSDKEFDDLFDKLKVLEEKAEFVLSNSPTRNVGAKVLPQLSKVSHEIPMLSLDKCHTTEELINFAGNDKCYLSVKYDGLSTRLIFENGQLISAATRGNGVEGTDITEHVKYYENIPMTIPYKERFVIDGESIILNQDFQAINNKLPENQQFKNSRNLASGTLNNLDMNIVKERHMKFFAWRVIEGFDDIDSNYSKLCGAYTLGFEVGLITTHCAESKEDVEMTLDWLKHDAERRGVQIDGIVMAKDSAKLSNQMGRTEKFFRHSIAYKFKDETYKTELLDIEWTVGRTGVVTPTAVFKPVEIDGTLVERASLSNISVMEETLGSPFKGEEIFVSKRNMIIPKIESARKVLFPPIEVALGIPLKCPVCGTQTTIQNTDNSEILVCTNPDCAAKKLAQFTHFVSRNCMNIDGLSERTLEVFISKGYIKIFRDIYDLHKYRDELIHLDGFGPKSIDKLLASIEKSRNVKLENFIAALGIDGIGLSAAKTISKYCNGSFDKFRDLFDDSFDWTELEDFGEITARNLDHYYDWHHAELYWTASEMNFIIPEKVEVKENPFTGRSLCITGKLHHFTRNSINDKIASLGAKAASSVSTKTDYLITNEQSGSSKYKKAVELNIPIITEDEFLEMIGE